MSIKFTSYPLDGICRLQMGKTPKRENKEYWGEGFSWVSIADMKGKFIETTKEQITAKAVEESGCKMISKGTLLMSFKLSIGKLAYARTDLFTNEAIVALQIRDYNMVYPEYLYYVLKTLPLAGRNIAAKGSTLNTKSLKRIPVPIPEKYEDQVRIARILQKADLIIQERELSIKQIDEYLKSVFEKMFGDTTTNNKKWDKVELKYFGRIITGNTPPRNNPKNYSSNFIEWIKTDNITTENSYITKANEHLSEVGLRYARTVENGALLVACIAGSIESIGRAALTDRKVSFNQQINAIQPNEDISPIFLYWLFKTSKNYVQNAASKGMKKILTKGDFEKIKMIKPPFEIQIKFANTVSISENLILAYKESSFQLQKFNASLTQRIFEGKVDLNKLDVTQEMNSLFELVESTLPLKEEEKKRRPKTTKVDKLTLADFYEDDFALLIKKHFVNFHFKFSDIEKMFSEEGGVITYHTTQELKQMKEKAPKDIQTFIFDCVEKQNKNLKLNQIFYNALTDLNLKKIKLKAGNETVMQQINDKQISIEDLSGIYFQIAK